MYGVQQMFRPIRSVSQVRSDTMVKCINHATDNDHATFPNPSERGRVTRRKKMITVSNSQTSKQINRNPCSILLLLSVSCPTYTIMQSHPTSACLFLVVLRDHRAKIGVNSTRFVELAPLLPGFRLFAIEASSSPRRSGLVTWSDI